ncbi:MAG: hypothetical protein KAS23_10485 [Anaerohalosphaera sp.]|nr:hypothetical protein [Anaerohalosphaera sp.]
MRHNAKIMFIVLMCAAVLVTVSTVEAKAKKGALTPKMIEKVQADFKMDAHARAMQNAVTATSIKSIAKNRDVLVDHVHQFSHRINTKGISNQQKSGRCWMFAGMNTLRPLILEELELSSFEFSHVYLQFWDKFEKANTFYENIIMLRDRDMFSREMVFLLKSPSPDGGYWENFADLVKKYGVIPEEAMAESASSDSTGMMNKNLDRLLRKHADELRKIHKETSSVAKMREAKAAMLAEVYKVLVINLGEPPKQFTWRYKVKKKADKDDEKSDEEIADEDNKEADDDGDKDKDDYDVDQKLSEPEQFTPKQFYKRFFNVNLNDYVNITNDPIRPVGTHCMIMMTRSLYDGKNMSYANVDIDQIKKMVADMLLDNKSVYFSADVSPNQESTKGIMEANLYDYESVYMLDMGLDKRQRLMLRDSVPNHGMAFIGLDIRDDKPAKWLVENSWGKEKGKGGEWTMYDNWFDEYVYSVIVHKDYVPKEVLDIFKKPAKKLTVWDPLW